MERLSGEWLTKRQLESEVEDRRNRSRPCMRLLDAVRRARKLKTLRLRDAKVKCIENEELTEVTGGSSGSTIV